MQAGCFPNRWIGACSTADKTIIYRVLFISLECACEKQQGAGSSRAGSTPMWNWGCCMAAQTDSREDTETAGPAWPAAGDKPSKLHSHQGFGSQDQAVAATSAAGSYISLSAPTTQNRSIMEHKRRRTAAPDENMSLLKPLTHPCLPQNPLWPAPGKFKSCCDNLCHNTELRSPLTKFGRKSKECCCF